MTTGWLLIYEPAFGNRSFDVMRSLDGEQDMGYLPHASIEAAMNGGTYQLHEGSTHYMRGRHTT